MRAEISAIHAELEQHICPAVRRLEGLTEGTWSELNRAVTALKVIQGIKEKADLVLTEAIPDWPETALEIPGFDKHHQVSLTPVPRPERTSND